MNHFVRFSLPAVLTLGFILAISCTKSTPPPAVAEQEKEAEEKGQGVRDKGLGGEGTQVPSSVEPADQLLPGGESAPREPVATSPLPSEPTTAAPVNTSSDFPIFTVDVSEYPSWIAFTYAEVLGLLDPEEGAMKGLERKWGVDIKLKSIDYEPCISAFSSGQVDATTLTNIDVLSLSEGRTAVAVFPTSTSDKADAIIATSSIKSLADLKGVTVWGLEKTVSEYVFDRILTKAGLDPDEFTYKMRDPGVAAMNMQQKAADVQAICVWNPFKLQTLDERKDEVYVLGDSGAIPLEVLDLMVVAQGALDREGGDRFAAALAETFYTISKRMNTPETRAETLTGMIEKFAPLTVEQMEVAVTETRFFATADAGLDLYANPQLPEVMKTVQTWTDAKGITTSKLKVGYGTKTEAPDATFRFDPTYMRLAQHGPPHPKD